MQVWLDQVEKVVFWVTISSSLLWLCLLNLRLNFPLTTIMLSKQETVAVWSLLVLSVAWAGVDRNWSQDRTSLGSKGMCTGFALVSLNFITMPLIYVLLLMKIVCGTVTFDFHSQEPTQIAQISNIVLLFDLILNHVTAWSKLLVTTISLVVTVIMRSFFLIIKW